MTEPFTKIEPTATVTPCWIVHSVGSAVEIVHVGPLARDIRPAIDRIAALFSSPAIDARVAGTGGHKVALLCDQPDVVVGVRVEDIDQDAAWRAMLGRFGDNTKIDTARVVLTINRVQYIALSRRAGLLT